MAIWIEIDECKSLAISNIPLISGLSFEQEVCEQMDGDGRIILDYFGVSVAGGVRCFIILGDRCDFSRAIITSYLISGGSAVSLTKRVPSIGVFEREISELYGIDFKGNSWLKPLRYPFDRADDMVSIGDYPFFEVDSEFLHQVHVGPVHAGIIEPGAFRFICEGEKIQHLEISLGYQHRGVERAICNTESRLRQVCLAETIAGDTTIGHTWAMCKIFENGWSDDIINCERMIALEMERIAMHIADTGALAMDSGYQLGQVACEALRTIVINSMQNWCGNRFGRTLIRPFGTNYKLDLDVVEMIKKNLEVVGKRYRVVARNLLNSPDFLARVDEICAVAPEMALNIGAVGISGAGGDILTRLKIRTKQIENSLEVIMEQLKYISGVWFESRVEPKYDFSLTPDSLSFSVVNGWRGSIVHVALSDHKGDLSSYKIVDPSVRNWVLLAMSVRGQEISDFPLSNKSYNLSYCGHDL